MLIWDIFVAAIGLSAKTNIVSFKQIACHKTKYPATQRNLTSQEEKYCHSKKWYGKELKSCYRKTISASGRHLRSEEEIYYFSKEFSVAGRK